MINKHNTCLITTTVKNNDISSKRRQNIKREMDKHDIPILFLLGKIEKEKLFFEIFRNRALAFKKTNFTYGILCDDDFHPHRNFLEELNKTVELLPKNWRCLHLCPGYLWGRKYRKCTEAGDINPEGDISDLTYHSSKRFFTDCGSGIISKKGIWLGGPIAVLVNQNGIDSFLNDYIESFKHNKAVNDVILTRILNNNDYICMNPMLGYEREQGGVTNI